MVSMTSAQVSVGSLQMGDVAVFVDGDVPFAVVAVSAVVDGVRLLDLVPVRGGRSRCRVTVGACQVVSVVGRDRVAAPREPVVSVSG